MITIFLSMKKVHFKYIFAGGFVMLGLAALFMYFEVQTDGLYERMKYPVIIRSTGMMMLYSLIPTYATQRMPYKFLSSWICTMITIRMVIAPSLGAQYIPTPCRSVSRTTLPVMHKILICYILTLPLLL